MFGGLLIQVGVEDIQPFNEIDDKLDVFGSWKIAKWDVKIWSGQRVPILTGGFMLGVGSLSIGISRPLFAVVASALSIAAVPFVIRRWSILLQNDETEI